MEARCSLSHEVRLRASGFLRIAGIDEAGRGPLAGPLVAAAVVLPDGFAHAELTDSKKLSAKVRERIYEELLGNPGVHHAVVALGSEDIDRLNILRATHEAMRQAVLKLEQRPDHALIDGLPVRPFPIAQTALVGGDGLSLSIAAASVLAKVTRDRMMLALDALYPQYAFAKHKGYGTALHMARLCEHGPSPVHRRSFGPVSQLVLGLS
ncbi:MAG: ribonuclease HII [Verrucomicrobia bacterium]|nr:ribonuclease HII [Verrucomicrobiota bacterium]